MDASKFWCEGFSFSIGGPLIPLSPVYCILYMRLGIHVVWEYQTVYGSQRRLYTSVSRRMSSCCVLVSLTAKFFFFFFECIRQAVRLSFFCLWCWLSYYTLSDWLLQYYLIACYPLLIYLLWEMRYADVLQ